MKRTKKGFTLIEVVIVIAVIAILAAIAIPVMNNVITSANANVDAANQKTIESVLKTYFTLNSTTAFSSATAATALTEANIDTELAVRSQTGVFLVDDGTFVVTLGASTGATQVTGFDNIYFK